MLGSGTRLGPYEVVDAIGAGGMGEVYRATDTRLKRQVALKVLPAALTTDPDRLARFQREAEVLASLNHPNIAALYGFEDSGGVKALVMELVEGPTLAERIARGPIAIDEALAIARQIAHALAAAHDQNVVHRDLKPANVKLRPDGDVKVLDFGLAKAMDPAAASASSVSMSPTITSPAQMTGAGVILGTAAYMSPEQAAGKPVDRRTDLWAFGVVLFEMLTGRRLFDGESVSHVIAAVLKDEPDWTALPPETPAGVRKLLRRCLEKDRRKRLSDASTAALDCEDVLTLENAGEAAGSPSTKPSTSRWPLVASFIAGATIVAGTGWMRWPLPAAPPESSRFAIDLPALQSFTRTGRHVLAMSPDGMVLAYVANQRLFVHSFRDLTTKEIQGTETADPSEPVFSPDGAWIAYWSAGMLRKIPVGGGSAVDLAAVENPFGVSWAGDRILVGQSQSIVEVPANGGPLTTLVRAEQGAGDWIQSPQLIDEGRAVLFTLRTGDRDWNSSNIVVQDLASGTRTTLVQGGTDGRLLPGGVLIYARDSALFAVGFDEHGRQISGSTVPLERDVMPSLGGFSGATQAAWSSATGSLAYAVDESSADSSLMWMTRQGKLEPTTLPERQYLFSFASFRLSPDGTRVAVRLRGATRSQTDLWIGDLTRGSFTRLTSTGTATDPVWTPDGIRVCYKDNPFDVRCQPFDGRAPAERLFQIDGISTVAEISRDGQWLLLSMNAQNGKFDVWAGANRPPFAMTPLLATPASEAIVELSPDGRWLAYRSDESGRDEVYVRPFPNVHQARWQVSTSGGTAPRWSKDGRELYYLSTRTGGAALRLTLNAAPINAADSFSVGPPLVIGEVVNRGGYDVAPDGRFLIAVPASRTEPATARSRIVVVRNRLDAARAQIGTAR